MRERRRELIEAHVSSIVLVGDGEMRVLLMRRSIGRRLYPGLWESTGGAVRVGESFVDAALRVAREEIGVEIDIRGNIGTYTVKRGDDEIAGALIPGVRFVGFIGGSDLKRVRVGAQHSEWRVVSPDDMAELKLIPTLLEDLTYAVEWHRSKSPGGLLR